jgi:hypothetical protein
MRIQSLLVALVGKGGAHYHELSTAIASEPDDGLCKEVWSSIL